MSTLFTPFQLKSVTLRNRIAIPPMCQYSAVDGFTNEWHQAHYAGLARGGAGLVIVEATGVSPEGRITPACTGLWNDQQIEGMGRIAASIKAAGAVPGIQIAHAGRKASAQRPWEGDDHIPESDARAWQPIAPSAIAYGGGLPRVPQAMTLQDIARVQADFVAAARRALAAGFEWLELHFAHGYLAQSFFSPHSNQRTDQYGGSFDNRARFLLETVAESIELVRQMRERGLDMVNVSANFVIAETQIPWATPAFLAPVAQRVRSEADLPVASSWGIDDPKIAERAVADGQMDLVMIGRAHLSNPHYTYHLAQVLGVQKPEWNTLPAPYAHWLSRYRGAAKVAAAQ